MGRVPTVAVGQKDDPTIHWNALRADYVSQTDTLRQHLGTASVIVKQGDGADFIDTVNSYAGEKKIEVPKGDYIINDKVTLKDANCTWIKGPAPGSLTEGARLIFRTDGEISLENTAGKSLSRVVFENLGFQDYGYYASVAYEASKVIHGNNFLTGSAPPNAERIWDFQLKNCHFYRFTKDLGGGDYCVPVDLPNLEHALFEHNVMHRGCKYLIRLYVADDYEMGNNRIINNYFGMAEEGGIAQRACIYTNGGIYSRGNQFLGSVAEDKPVAYVYENAFVANIHCSPAGFFGPNDRTEGMGYMKIVGADANHKIKNGRISGNMIGEYNHADQNMLDIIWMIEDIAVRFAGQWLYSDKVTILTNITGHIFE